MTSDIVYVYVKTTPARPVIAGRLTFLQDGVEFIYAKSWLKSTNRFAFHPTLLPLTDDVYSSHSLSGVLSVFRDSGPGAWGREVIKRLHGAASQSDQLVLSNNLLRIGAFRYAATPDCAFDEPETTCNINSLYDAVKALEDGSTITTEQSILLDQGASMDGMRPKSFVTDNRMPWIIKLPSKNDYENKAVSELIGMHLSSACDIETPVSKVINLSGDKQAFLVRRFDTMDGMVYPLMSAASAMGFAGTEDQKKDYRFIAQTIRAMSARPVGDCESLFRRMALNVMISNKDDHIFNLAMIRQSDAWRLSPAYDVVCGEGNRRDHAMRIGELGNEGSLSNVLSSSTAFGLGIDTARDIVAEMIEVVSEWRDIVPGLSDKDAKAIEWAILHDDIFKGSPFALRKSAHTHLSNTR